MILVQIFCIRLFIPYLNKFIDFQRVQIKLIANDFAYRALNVLLLLEQMFN